VIALLAQFIDWSNYDLRVNIASEAEAEENNQQNGHPENL